MLAIWKKKDASSPVVQRYTQTGDNLTRQIMQDLLAEKNMPVEVGTPLYLVVSSGCHYLKKDKIKSTPKVITPPKREWQA